MTIRDRITAFRRIPARELRPNPYNWRTHSRQQQRALEAVGDAGETVFNGDTGQGVLQRIKQCAGI